MVDFSGLRRTAHPTHAPGPWPTSRWNLPDPTEAFGVDDGDDFVAVGADLAPGTLLAAYSKGLFPMPFDRRRIGWWSPDPRGILPLDGLRISKSLRRNLREYEVRFDTEFTEVMRRCSRPGEPTSWIDESFIAAYSHLHRLGWAHSVECWRDDRLVGGLYGVRIRGLFAGESMFHDPVDGTDASKVALVALVEWLSVSGGRLLDVQWQTPHLASLGVIAIPRAEYLTRLADALAA